jgi:hypothetical protein
MAAEGYSSNDGDFLSVICFTDKGAKKKHINLRKRQNYAHKN